MANETKKAIQTYRACIGDDLPKDVTEFQLTFEVSMLLKYARQRPAIVDMKAKIEKGLRGFATPFLNDENCRTLARALLDLANENGKT